MQIIKNITFMIFGILLQITISIIIIPILITLKMINHLTRLKRKEIV